MTKRMCYHAGMLLSVQGLGALYSVLALLICVLVVFGFRLARISWRSLYKKLPPEAPPKAEKPAEPVYFLVERKKKRARAEYSAPKRIDFK